jgi:hypothetical protein
MSAVHHITNFALCFAMIAQSYLQQTSSHYKDNIYEVNNPDHEITNSLKQLTPAQHHDL